jgi:hypothetical protein
MHRLHHLKEAGKIKAFALPYLGSLVPWLCLYKAPSNLRRLAFTVLGVAGVLGVHL